MSPRRAWPEPSVPARLDGWCRRNDHAHGYRNTGSQRRQVRPCHWRMSAAGWSRRRPTSFLRDSICPFRPSGSRPSRAARRCSLKSRHRRPSSTPGYWSRRDCRQSRKRAEPVRHEMVALLHQPHQHRHVRVLPDIILEILGLPVEIELAQDHVTHRHSERRIGALLHRDPQIGEFRRFRIVRADHHALGAADSAPRYRNAHPACGSAERWSPTGSGSPNCTSRRFQERRSARPRSGARPAASRNTSRRTTCRRRRAATDSESRPRSRPSTSPGSARTRDAVGSIVSWRYRRWRPR